MSPLLDYDEALRRLRGACAPLPAEDCASEAAPGRVLAAAVRSEVALPPFDNAAMDGFALGTDAAAGSEWPLGGEQAAGDGAARAAPGCAWEIMTGAQLPTGLDRVVPVEQAERLPGTPARIRLHADVAAAQNVRAAGSDVARGDIVLHAGTVLGPQHLMLLAALGVATVRTVRRPRVALLCTGRELVDDPAQVLAPGQIRNSNGPFLAARLQRAGAELVQRNTVGDDEAAFETALGTALDAGAGIVLTTGAVSMGRYDFIPRVLNRLRAQTLFHKVAVRPGKPLLLARLPHGALLFGLPGNPIAGAVGLRFFVEPALRVMLGLAPEQPWRLPLLNAFRKRPPLRFHLKAQLQRDADGNAGVTVLPGQESYRIAPLAAANAWAVVAADVEALDAGDAVDVYGPGHLESPLPFGSPA